MEDKTNMLARCVILITALLPGCFGRTLQVSDENEINRERPLPTVDSDFLEAYYYEHYAGGPHSGWTSYVRAGNATTNNSCTYVRGVPEELRHAAHMRPLGVSSYYTKYTEAYDIPVLAPSNVPDAALSRACYVLRFLLADRADLRQAYYKYFGRVAIIPENSSIKAIPEYLGIDPDFGLSTRGLGAIPMAPVSTAGEENVLCYEDDDSTDDILIREIAQGIFHLAARQVVPGIYSHLKGMYETVLESGWWDNTYAEHSAAAYFGEGVQSFFNVNGYANPADGYHNAINTRTKLRSYDSGLSNLIQEIFPCVNNYIKRCRSRGNESYQHLRMNCPTIPSSRRQRRRHPQRYYF